MVNILDTQDIQYLNLFSSITGVNTKYCFKYNEMIVFLVPRELISRALGRENSNLRRMSEMTRRRIRIIAEPNSDSEAKRFIEVLVSPITFRDVKVTNDEIILNAGSKTSKAMLIGRNKKRLLEMEKIIKSLFEKEFVIA